MWTQVSLNNALGAFLEGRDVRIWEEDTVKSLSEVLSEIPDSVVFLVDKDADAAPAQDIPMDKLVEFVVDGPPDEEPSAEKPEKVEPEPEPDPPPKASRAKKQLEEAEKNFQKRKIGDIGKLRSLRAAGWSLKKLAEEFGCSEATVYNTMKREGIE
jgi:transcriptional regulator with GAF, ATPase, and Fis domain